MKLSFKQKFNTRQEISVLLGGDTQKGIAVSAQTDTILLFMNDGEIYTDYFLPFKLIVATAWVANFNVDLFIRRHNKRSGTIMVPAPTIYHLLNKPTFFGFSPLILNSL